MKLVQNLKLWPNHSITTWLSKDDSDNSDMPLLEQLELSFHPFSITAWAARDCVLSPDLKADHAFVWRVMIIDDEENKALLHLKSSNRVLLMLSEMLLGLFECSSQIALSLITLEAETDSHMLRLSFRVRAGSDTIALFGGALCLKAALDSLLFCRGLAVGFCTFESRETNSTIEALRAILLAQL